MLEDAIGEPILIRYDGLDADRHEIEMDAFADSLKGLSRIMGVCGNFAATHRYVQHKDALAVRVVVQPPEAHCLEIVAAIVWAASNPLVSTTVGGLFATLITYIFKRAAGQREEMRQLRGALDTAIKELGTRDQAIVDRLLDTVDKMADALKPAAKLAVAPIGVTATTLSVGSVDGSRRVVLGQVERDAIHSDIPAEVDDERTYHVLISELDMESGGCRVSFADDPGSRITGKITDPVVGAANNPYALAMAAQRLLTVRGKATLREGEIERLYISNTVRDASSTDTVTS